MSRFVNISFVLLIAMLVAPAHAQKRKPRRSPAKQPPIELIAEVDEHFPEAWQLFKSAAGGFSILFPGEPKETITVDNISTGKVTEHRIQLITNIALYEANYADGPVKVDQPNMQKLVLDALRADVLQRNPGSTLSDTDMTIQGHPAREVVWRTEKGLLMTVRCILCGNRIYSVLFAVQEQENQPAAEQAFRKSIAAKYFESFKIAAPDAAVAGR